MSWRTGDELQSARRRAGLRWMVAEGCLTALPLPWLAGSRSLGCVIVHVRADERAGGQAGHVVILEAETTALSAGLGSSQSQNLWQSQCLPPCLLPPQPFHSSFSVPQTAAPPLQKYHPHTFAHTGQSPKLCTARVRVCEPACRPGPRADAALVLHGPAPLTTVAHKTEKKRRGRGPS